MAQVGIEGVILTNEVVPNPTQHHLVLEFRMAQNLATNRVCSGVRNDNLTCRYIHDPWRETGLKFSVQFGRDVARERDGRQKAV